MHGMIGKNRYALHPGQYGQFAGKLRGIRPYTAPWDSQYPAFEAYMHSFTGSFCLL